MKNNWKKVLLAYLGMTLWWVAGGLAATVTSVAVFDFEADLAGEENLGGKVSDLVNTFLSVKEGLILVERAELSKVLSESELSLSGSVAEGKGLALGNLTGAKVLVTGRVLESGSRQILVAKVIGCETGRVYGVLVRGYKENDLSDLAEELAGKIAGKIRDNRDSLVARERPVIDRIAELKKVLGEGKRTRIRLSIPEKHFGAPTFDPAVETELGKMLTELGFTVVEELKSENEVDFDWTGEAFSAFGLRMGNLVSCKARVEIKVRDQKTGEVTVVDRQVTVAVDLSEQIAAKTALQEAAVDLAERVIPKLIR